MKEYRIPTKDATAEFIERRSRFMGHIFLTETEEEALKRIKEMREKYWDATHNVYAYIIKDGPTRFSDDGEPGGTAGSHGMLPPEKSPQPPCPLRPGGRGGGPADGAA